MATIKQDTEVNALSELIADSEYIARVSSDNAGVNRLIWTITDDSHPVEKGRTVMDFSEPRWLRCHKGDIRRIKVGHEVHQVIYQGAIVREYTRNIVLGLIQ